MGTAKPELIEVELSYHDVGALVRRHLFDLLDRKIARLPWRITRIGPRGIEITLLDEAYIEAKKQKAAERAARRLDR